MLDFSWLVVFLILLILIFIIIAIISIRITWNNDCSNNINNSSNLQFSMIWLYVSLALTFLAGLLLSISIIEKPQTCKLPYSGKLSKLEPNSETIS